MVQYWFTAHKDKSTINMLHTCMSEEPLSNTNKHICMLSSKSKQIYFLQSANTFVKCKLKFSH